MPRALSVFHPLRTLAKWRMQPLMRCFQVLIHGAFRPRLNFGAELSAHGFYTTRWVLASDEQTAIKKGFSSARRELLTKQADIRDGLVSMNMEAEEIAPGSWWRWLKGGGGGFSFYTDD